MKLHKLALAAVLATFSVTAMAEGPYYVGAGNGGALLSTNGGCVKSQTIGKEFPECGGTKAEEPKPIPLPPVAEKPKQKVVIIRDCARCHGKQPKGAMKPMGKRPAMGKRPPKLMRKR